MLNTVSSQRGRGCHTYFCSLSAVDLIEIGMLRHSVYERTTFGGDGFRLLFSAIWPRSPECSLEFSRVGYGQGSGARALIYPNQN
jgi:hypothetical protein